MSDANATATANCPDHAQILTAARQQIEAQHAAHAAQPGMVGAGINLANLLANLEKFGPGIVNSLIPLAGGFTPQTIAAVVIGIVQVVSGGGVANSPAADPTATAI